MSKLLNFLKTNTNLLRNQKTFSKTGSDITKQKYKSLFPNPCIHINFCKIKMFSIDKKYFI